jgi:hypothetical protein
MSVTMSMRGAAPMLLVLAAGLLLAVAPVQIATPTLARGRHPLLTARGTLLLGQYCRHTGVMTVTT